MRAAWKYLGSVSTMKYEYSLVWRKNGNFILLQRGYLPRWCFSPVNSGANIAYGWTLCSSTTPNMARLTCVMEIKTSIFSASTL